MKISEIKLNPNNPRIIKDERFEKLKRSIDEFPKMMKLRPIVINNDSIILGGNMRLKALKELGYKELPDEWVKRAEELTEDEQRRLTFTLADEQAEQIKNAIADIKQTEEYKYAETMGNENSNGNALYLIVMQWEEQRK